jgi:N6-L-threonylcarbamoyladenine synthase
MNDIYASVQDRIVSILLNKLQKQPLQHDIKSVAIAGGVSNNNTGLFYQCACRKKRMEVFIPKFEYCKLIMPR